MIKKIINYIDYCYYNTGVFLWNILEKIFKLVYVTTKGLLIYCLDKRAEHHVIRITKKKKKKKRWKKRRRKKE